MLKNILVLLLSSLLYSCATYNIQSTDIDPNEGLPEKHGVVAVEVINNTDQLNNLHKGWTQIYAIRLDNMEQRKQEAIAKAKAKAKGKSINEDKVDWSPDLFRLNQRSKGVIDSQVFIGSMPAGKYIISQLYSYYSDGNVTSWVRMPVGVATGEFLVKPKELANLGSLVFQPLQSVKEPSFWSSASSRKAYVTRLNNPRNLGRYVVEQYPKIIQKLKPGAVSTWQDDKFNDLRSVLSDLSRENSYGNKAIAISSNGAGVVASRFGQLRVRNQDQTWSQVNLPTNSQLTSAILLDNQWVIGGEYGEVYVGTGLDNKWESHTPVHSSEAINWLGQGETINFALTNTDRKYYVYQFTDIKSSWIKIGEFVKKPKHGFFVINGDLFPIITSDKKLRIFNDTEIHDYDIASKNWTQSKGTGLVKLAQSRNGVLLGLEVSHWDGIGDQVISYDNGTSWQDISRRLDLFGDNKTDASLPAILSNGHIATLGRVKKSKNTKSFLKIITTDKENVSKSKSWKSHGDAKDTCHTMLPELTLDKTLYFLCDQGDIVSTNDLGESWNTDIKIDIQSMTQEYDRLLEAVKESEDKD